MSIPLVRLIAALVLSAAVMIISPNPASAVQGSMSRTSLTTSVTVSVNQSVDLITLPPKTLQAGQSIFLQGRVQARSNTVYAVGQVAEIGCLGGPGTVGEVRATRNHEGTDFPYATPGELFVLVDYLFTAPANGTYTCRLITRIWTSEPTRKLTIVPSDTRIEVSDDVQVGAHNWLTKECNSYGTTPTCLYIGAPGHPDTTWVFYSDFSPRYIWRAASNATRVEARGVLQITTCNEATASCIDSVDQYGTHGSSLVGVRLEFIQLDSQNMACATFATPTEYYTVGQQAHHYVLTRSISPVTPDPNCTRNFILRFYVNHAGGNPVKIDGVSEGFIQTNASAFNLFD